MGKRVKVLLGATLAIAVLGISAAAIAGATGGDDDGSEQAITGRPSTVRRQPRSSTPAAARSRRPRPATRRALTRSR